MTAGRTFKEIIQDDLCRKDLDSPENHLKIQRAYNKLASDMAAWKEKDMAARKYLYEVMAVYGGFDEPTIMLSKKPFIHGATEEEAIIRSGIHKTIPADWDPAYTTIVCRELCAYKIRT